MVREESIVIFNADIITGNAIVREMLDPQNRQHLAQRYRHVFASVHDQARSGDLLALGACVFEMEDNPEERKLIEYLKNANVKTVVLVPDCGSKHMVNQAKKIINAAKQAGVERLALLSKLGIEDMSVELAKWYCEMENHLKQSGISTTGIVRHAPLTQWLFLYRQMLERQKLQLPVREDARFTNISVRDIANFVVHELVRGERFSPNLGPHMFKLTGPHVHTVKDLCHMFESILGENIKYEQIDRREFERYLREQIGLHEIIAKEICDMKELINKGHLNFVSDDHKKSTGREPMKTEEWLNKHKTLFARP